MSKADGLPDGLMDEISDDNPVPEGHKPDLSWLVVAIDGGGDGWVMDSAPGFNEVDLLPNGNLCLDNGVYMPKDLPVGLYRVTDVSIGGGELVQSPNGDDYTEIEISGSWRRLDGDQDHMPEDAMHVVFDGPAGPQSGRFVELHDDEGRGLGPEQSGTEWREDGKYWTLGPFYRRPPITTSCKGRHASVPPLPGLKGRTYFVKNSDDEWCYLNHGGNWVTCAPYIVQSWSGMGTAPRDGETFLLDRGGDYQSSVPCFRHRQLVGGALSRNTDEEGREGDGWLVVEGCPDEGGYGCATTYVPDSLVSDGWRWSPIPGTGENNDAADNR